MNKRGVSGGSSPLEPAEREAGFVAVAHGSSDPRAAAAIGELVPLVAERAAARGLNVPELRVAYLGHSAPSVPQVMRAFGANARVTVLPLLLTAAYHSKTDIPRVLARTSAQVTYGATLGPHPLLLDALERRLAEAGLPWPPAAAGPAALEEDPAEVGVVLAAAGSSDPQANAAIARLAAQWQARTGWYAVRPAYASATTPDPAMAVRQLREAGARRVVVATYLLAPGLFADRIAESSLAAGAAAVAPVLGALPEVADVVLDRYAEAGTRQRTAA